MSNIKTTSLLDPLGQDRQFLAILASLALLLTVWSVTSKLITGGTYEAPISSSRLLLETLFVCVICARPRWRAWTMKGLVILATLNGVVVVFQLYESAGLIGTNLSYIITDLWRLPVNDITRKPGLFNGLLTAGLISLVAICTVIRRHDPSSLAVIAICSMAVLFGARTYLLFLPLLLIFNWRAATITALTAVVIGASIYLFAPVDIISIHIRDRILPTAAVIYSGNAELDYSVRDLVTHYDIQGSFSLLFGNGQPRYSSGGGQDPAVTRWMLQAGIPGLILVLSVNVLIAAKIVLNRGLPGGALAMATLASLFKAEITTSAGVYSLIVLFALSKSHEK